jgi:hypothetical protein
MAATLAHAEPTVAQLWLSRLNPEARRPEPSRGILIEPEPGLFARPDA